MFEQAQFISAGENVTCVPVFRKIFDAVNGSTGRLLIGGYGTYDVYLNGKKLRDDVLAPGWQETGRICASEYTLEELESCNELTVLLTTGWYAGRINRAPDDTVPRAIIAQIELKDNTYCTDQSWQVSDSQVVSADIYDGTVYDANITESWQPVEVIEGDRSVFVTDTTVHTKEFDTVFPVQLIVTPKGEKVLDFGINLVGYPVLNINARKGEKVSFSFAEILDKDGNFYNENYRSAKCLYDYTCREGHQFFTPHGTFYGFRYLRIDAFPSGCDPTDGCVTARIIHADMARTGWVNTGNPLVNRLFDNVIRGQLSNYLAIPSDCPQRDERLGWTGDTQIFMRTAAYNFDVKDFIKNWLIDLVQVVKNYGFVERTVPLSLLRVGSQLTPRAAWADAVTICPWEIYRTYGDVSVLENTFDTMCIHLDGIAKITKKENLFFGCEQYADWLGLDAPEGSYQGSSNPDLVASAYYAYSTELVCRIGAILGRDVSKYQRIYHDVRKAFCETFDPKTQTECAVTLKFGLTDDAPEIARRLADRIHAAGDRLETGFVGTPYILHALSENGYTELAYTLLLRTEFPSWLYPVTMGATTVWEHWDGLRPDGKLWSKNMNSYNHYAYGAVVDWIYAVAAGINPDAAGYEHAVIAPQPDKRLQTLNVTFESVRGRFVSSWYYEGDKAHYSITTPVPATVIIDGDSYDLPSGSYVF